MNALASLLPTHALFAQAASAPSASSADSPSALSAPQREHDPIRKYVIVRDQDGREHTLLFSRHLQHSTVVPSGFTPVAAGFLYFSPAGAKVLNFDSTSLHLSPRTQDQQLINKFVS